MSTNDLVWTWTVRQFAGEGIGSRIYWEKQSPGIKAPGTNHYPSPSSLGSIRVSTLDQNGFEMDGEMQWATAVMELNNIRNGPLFNRSYTDARAKRITKNEFIKRNSRLEFNALHGTRCFYGTIWLKNSVEHHKTSNGWCWRANLPDDFDTWFTQEDATSYRRYWGSVFP